VTDALDRLAVPYEVNHRLVRGLDYYTRTAFEFYVAGREGQQDALGGGGRYDGLVELLGGPATPGIGFGIGIDRTVLAMEAQEVAADAAPSLVAVVGAEADATRRMAVATRLRDAGVAVRLDGSTRKLGRQLESAVKAGARWAVILGDGERVALKDLASGTQRDDLAVDEVPALVA
jgi:histidyl-tRNA synthetase